MIVSKDFPEYIRCKYKELFGSQCDYIERLTGAGSNRQYFLVGKGNDKMIFVRADNTDEGKAFAELSKVFGEAGINVPEVFYSAPDGRWNFQQYLGKRDLFSLFSQGIGIEIGYEVMRQLAKMQTVPETRWIDVVGFSPFGARMIGWDLNYFKYEYLKSSGIEFSEEKLEDDFERFKGDLLSIPKEQWGFMMRDCQSRNVMLVGDEPYFIDFQGGRKGPCLYDAVSFAWQAKAALTYKERDSLVDIWIEEFSRLRGIKKEDISRYKGLMILFRILQVLGAYGFRGLVERKSHFIESIPPALDNLNEVLYRGYADNYPELCKICKKLIEDNRFKVEDSEGLTITVFSFSYKKGYPDDFSGNGGGFMFDCRGMHNPGRYEEYKPLTGMDRPVKEFLEEKGEVQGFVEIVENICSKSIDVYRKRNFTSLQIGFGCTGGRHRSVYCAESLGHRLAKRFPDVGIRIVHREQGIEKVINNKSCQ